MVTHLKTRRCLTICTKIATLEYTTFKLLTADVKNWRVNWNMHTAN